MITKEEIKEHLAKTVYSSGARKSIIGYLVGAGYDTNDIEFAKRDCSAREIGSKTFEDFIMYIREKDMPKFGLSYVFRGMCEEAAQTLAGAVDALNKAVNGDKSDDFQIGDWVKYMPEPSESSTECIEAIAHGTDGEMYLCLSNGEYVRPGYCVKYKAQGEERRKLIDKLNEVI